jgi:hypothetical protein
MAAAEAKPKPLENPQLIFTAKDLPQFLYVKL